MSTYDQAALDKAVNDARAAPRAPESYTDFKFPEGVTQTADELASAHSLFKELDLTQDAAQRYIDHQWKNLTQAQAAAKKAEADRLAEWDNAAKSDKEIGGDNFDKSVATARIALNKLGGEAASKFFTDNNLIRHPEVIRLLSKVGAQLKEDEPGTRTPPAAAQKPLHERMYATQ